jgi:hypothetical protein
MVLPKGGRVDSRRLFKMPRIYFMRGLFFAEPLKGRRPLAPLKVNNIIVVPGLELSRKETLLFQNIQEFVRKELVVLAGITYIGENLS